MSVNSIRQTVSVMSNWRSDLKHIKEAKAKADEWKRRKQAKNQRSSSQRHNN
jgi:hypothetical protein